MRILITGGSGFIGSNLVMRLSVDKNNRIFNLDKISYASDNSFIDFLSLNKSDSCGSLYELLKIDLVDFEKTLSAMKYSDPDLIFHLAAESHVDRSIDNSNEFVLSNIVGTHNLLQSALIHWQSLSINRKDNFKFIHVSTDEVFGSLGMTGCFSENSAYSPRSPYSATKASSDHLVKAWFHTYGLPVVISHSSNNYGPRQFPEKLIPLTIINALKGLKIPLYGEGSNIRDWIFVQDHIDALLSIASMGRIGENYCVGGGSEKTNKEVVESICEHLQQLRPSNNLYKDLITYVADRKGHDFRYSIDSSKINTELGWKISHSFDEGLGKTIRWYLDNSNWYDKVQQNNMDS